MSSNWVVTHQAVEAYRKAAQADAPARAAFDRLWGRLDIDPGAEGTPLSAIESTADPYLKRAASAMRKLTKSLKSQTKGGADPRLTYEIVEGPSLPPPWLVCSVHLPDFPMLGEHLLVSLAKVDRQGRATQ